MSEYRLQIGVVAPTQNFR